ncbi:glycosyltransferase family 4 protein [Microcystis aeruginosa CS-555/01A07]|uniref:glycosyltransferase family 4 protein n=1 Tax=Microcystis aeruginosa TaxID=1126 RepID=UPI00232E0653|nr:glycosyltransferase family 4 protein [Microcystis aeruginosa]MDB9430537.1 glycosyltransferase family 4 protein [Microcystis aeruginosa CS-555/01A07]
MRVCLLSHSDGRGGAYAAAYRLHQGLRKMGVDSTMLVGDKTRDDHTVLSPNSKLAKGWSKLTPTLDHLPLMLYPNRDHTPYSIQWISDRIASQVAQLAPDIINLHWVNAGYLQIETVARLNKPLVWTIHDMWPFTGGCHYSGECDRYMKSCGSCPQLHSDQDWDISRWVWQRKAKNWKNLNLTIITPSRWLADCAKNSSLFQNLRIEVIANGLDIKTYRPIEQKLARHLLNLPHDKQLILFGAMSANSDHRKGFQFLLPALQKLNQTKQPYQIELVVFGASEPIDSPDLGFKVHYLGRLNDDILLALVYSAADVMIVPSIQESFGQTASEALSCGTPVVAFNATGLKDIVEHQQNGYLAQPFEVEDLAKGIAWVLEDRERYGKLCDRAREKVVQEFSLEVQAKYYLSVYQDIYKFYLCTAR